MQGGGGIALGGVCEETARLRREGRGPPCRALARGRKPGGKARPRHVTRGRRRPASADSSAGRLRRSPVESTRDNAGEVRGPAGSQPARPGAGEEGGAVRRRLFAVRNPSSRRSAHPFRTRGPMRAAAGHENLSPHPDNASPRRATRGGFERAPVYGDNTVDLVLSSGWLGFALHSGVLQVRPPAPRTNTRGGVQGGEGLPAADGLAVREPRAAKRPAVPDPRPLPPSPPHPPARAAGGR